MARHVDGDAHGQAQVCLAPRLFGAPAGKRQGQVRQGAKAGTAAGQGGEGDNPQDEEF